MKIIHISDLHFGTEIQALIAPLIEEIKLANPDLIVVSGDLTQRATFSQFKQVNDFLYQLKPLPILCVPGNHDIPLFNILERLVYPFSRYKKWIGKNYLSSFVQGNVAILGINSVTGFKPMGGYVTDKQLKLVKHFFEKNPATLKIIVMHHNLIASERHRIINDAEKILGVYAEAGVNLILSGHIHYAYVEPITRNFLQHKMYVITAGTAISTRTIQPNSYNMIEISDLEFKWTVRAREENHYSTSQMLIYPLI